jgi:hypothetical protein
LSRRAHDRKSTSAAHAVEKHAIHGRLQSQRLIHEKIVPWVALSCAGHTDGMRDFALVASPFLYCFLASFDRQFDADFAEQRIQFFDCRQVTSCIKLILARPDGRASFYTGPLIDR